MIPTKDPKPEETLDPQDWEAMRDLGHRMVDDMMDYLQSLRGGPVWQHAPDHVKARFDQPLPLDPQPAAEVYQEFLDTVLPYPIGNLHPRFWGWVFGTGTPFGAYAEFLAAVMNTNSGDFDHHSAIHVEKQVVDWCKQILGYPQTASGLLTSGCSAANLIGLTVARNAKAPEDIRRRGLQQVSPRMVLYASAEIHSSITRAVEILGLGSEALRMIPSNPHYQVDLDALTKRIKSDRQAGYTPFCVVGAAGTTNTGACDDLDALADVCQAEDLWLHVDGAFGAWAALAPAVKHMVAGMERADSLAFDLHKWMYMPFEIGCLLVRHPEVHRDTFSQAPVYISREGEGLGLTGGDLPWFTDYGFQLSRGFRALKAWMSFKEHGLHKYSRLVQQNIDQIRYLADLITAAPELELCGPVPLNILNFRFTHPLLDDKDLDALNKEILVTLQESGLAVVSGTTLEGRYVMRVGHTNHRSRRDDFDLMVTAVIRIGSKLLESLH